MTQQAGAVTLSPVTAANWRAAADLEVRPEQERFVAPVARYLAMCAYDDGPWQPFVVERDGRVVGFVMEGVDTDGSAWVGGLVVDRQEQRHARLGFVETGETEDDEVVARLPLAPPVAPAGGAR